MRKRAPRHSAEDIAAYAAIFTDDYDDRYARFRDWVPERELLYPVHYTLDEPDLAAIFSAAEAIGERAIVLHMIDLPLNAPLSQLIAVGDLASYDAQPPGLEHALLSPGKRWGFRTIDGDAAIIGGEPDFMDAFRRYWPHDLESGRRRFVEHVASYGYDDLTWMMPLLAHLFGEDDARRYSEFLARVRPEENAYE